MDGWRLSLVIPAFNEQEGIAAAVAEADDSLAGLAADYEVLIVDDGSHDDTFATATEAASNRPHVRVLRHSENRGYGAALRTGFEAARFEHVAFTDADCQFYLDDLAALVPLAEHYPVVAGRRMGRQDSARRRFYSWGYNQLVRALLGTRVHDCDCALKVFRREALATLLPESRGFFVNAEMLARARQAGLAITEVGVRHRPRFRGTSKVSLVEIPRTLGTLLPFWWTRILFPAQATVEPHVGWVESSRPTNPLQRCGGPRRLGPPYAALWAILIAVAVLLFFTHFRTPLQEPQESRYAEIPRQMLVEGRWIVPVLHGQPYLDKPPLLYWLVMASYRIFGVHDWAARLVPCLAGFFTVLVTFGWGRRVVGPRAALAGALVLCLSARFVQLGRMLVMDGPLCLEILTGWAAAHLALREGRLHRGWWVLSAAAVGLGVLTKGPVALILVALPVLVYQVLDARAAKLGIRVWLAYLGVVVAVAGPWYLLIALCDPQFLGYFFWDHNVRRFVEPFDHAQAGWFYLPALLLGMLPWTLLLPGLAAYLGSRSPERANRRPAALGFFLLTFLWCLGFYSLAGCKRPYYILPAMPPLALAIGCFLDAELSAAGQRFAAFLRHRSQLAFGATVLVLVAGVATGLAAVHRGMIVPIAGLALASALVAGIGGLLYLQRGRRWAIPWAWCGVATFALLLVGAERLLPGYARKFSLRGQVRRLAEDSRSARTPVLCYPHRWDSVNFYLQRDDVQVYTPDRVDQLLAELRRQPEVLVFVKSEKWLDDLLHHLPPSLEFVPHQRQGFVTVGYVRWKRNEQP